jgi:AcrR family transcriptional regulator
VVKERSTGNPTRRRILKAARRLFAARNYDAVSVGELARAARVNRASLYYYFEDKAALYRAVIADALEVIPDVWRHADVTAGAPPERLKHFIARFGAGVAKNRELFGIVIRELTQGGKERDFILKEYLVPNVVNLVGLIEAGMKTGDFAAGAPFFAGLAVVSGVVFPNIGAALVSPVAHPFARQITRYEEYLTFYAAYVNAALAPGRRDTSVARGGRRGADGEHKKGGPRRGTHK